MTNSSSKSETGEFDLIARFFAPLTLGAPGAYALTDDAATFAPPSGEEIVLSADLLSEGVHFRSADPPDLIARKALRVNLSDLAAKGARARAYLLSLAVPRSAPVAWFESFACGLAQDQQEFGVCLLGGDTTATDGPLTVAVTAIGTVPSGAMIRRSGARPGDSIYVTGTIGDAGAGLALLQQIDSHPMGQPLIDRYQLPTPRLSVGLALRGVASAALDVSDGLLADLTHIAEQSNVHVSVMAGTIPLSSALRSVLGGRVGAVIDAAMAGDDYEIAFTAPASAEDKIAAVAARTGTPITRIGRVETGNGITLLDSAGAEIPISRKGYRHF